MTREEETELLKGATYSQCHAYQRTTHEPKTLEEIGTNGSTMVRLIRLGLVGRARDYRPHRPIERFVRLGPPIELSGSGESG